MPFFWIGDNERVGEGTHVAFAAPDRATVDAFYAAAIAAGGKDNGGARAEAANIIPIITARSCSIPTGSTSRR